MRRAASIEVLLWRTVARLTVANSANTSYTTIEQLHNQMLHLIKIWRRVFGTFNTKTNLEPPAAPAMIWDMATFCSTDAALAILLFCDLAESLQTRLDNTQSTAIDSNPRNRLSHSLQLASAERHPQRLTSAEHVSAVAAANGRRIRHFSAETSHVKVRNAAIHPVREITDEKLKKKRTLRRWVHHGACTC